MDPGPHLTQTPTTLRQGHTSPLQAVVLIHFLSCLLPLSSPSHPTVSYSWPRNLELIANPGANPRAGSVGVHLLF